MKIKPINFTAGPISVGFMKKYSQFEIKSEPQFFRATKQYALKHGGPITKDFISRIPSKENLLVDSKVHLLMPGMYPAIPGWHLDDVPRTRVDGQPEHQNPKYRSRHYCAVLGGNSMTEFLAGNLTLIDVPSYGGNIYSIWHHQIEELLKMGKIDKFPITEGMVLNFGFGDFHQATPAKYKGYRIFIRATFGSHLVSANEIRKQSQVYLTQPFLGW